MSTARERAQADDEIRIGISACLLGEEVRWDGGHKRDRFLTDTLAAFVRFVPVCPEVEIGLGVPRPTLRLVRAPSGTRLVERGTGRDHTQAMAEYAARKVDELAALDLSGFVLKKDSPSCGLARVRVHAPEGTGSPKRDGRGLFAEALHARCPQLPLEEEGRLCDPALRENFFERVFAYRRLERLLAPGWTLGDLVEFHTSEKLLLFAHHERGYRALGRLVAEGKALPHGELGARYRAEFLGALAHRATVRRHVNVLQHVAGYFKDAAADDRAELAGLIEDYRNGLVPLVVPITLVRHFVRKHGLDYLARQTYVEPHPKELMLRNHA